MSWFVDGFEWSVPCTIQRIAEVTESEISGMMLDKSYYSDVLGTWLKYTISVAVPKGMEGEYEALYEILTDPIGGDGRFYHEFQLPYGDGVVNINGRVKTVSDTYVRLPNNKQTWRKITFDVIANAPTKTAYLDEVDRHGLTPYPTNVTANIGDLYEYTNSGWVRRNYGDGDATRY